jgi:hypothetical protein
VNEINDLLNTNMKRIVIICQGRTGSTNLSDYYKKKYKIKNMGEVFRNSEYKKDPSDLFKKLTNKPNWIIKLIPIQVLNSAVNEFLKIHVPNKTFNDKIRIRQNLEDFQTYGTEGEFYKKNKKEIVQIFVDICSKIILLSDKHIFLYRRDFNSQVKSLVIANRTNEFGPERIKEKTAALSYEIQNTFNSLRQTYELVRAVFLSVPGETLAIEDFNFGKKYNPVKLLTDVSQLEFYDVEKEVFDIKKPAFSGL